MRSKTKVEVAVVVFFLFAIVFVAPVITKQVTNEYGKLVVRGLLIILYASVPLIMSRISGSPIGGLGFKKDKLPKQVLIGICIFAAMDIIYTILVFALGDNKTMLLNVKKNGIDIIIANVIFNMLFVGMAEETVFRGYLLGRFQTLFNSGVWAVVASSLIFGLWHFPGSQDFLKVIITALIGAIFGTARLKIKNCTTLSIAIAHGLHDSCILILSCILL